MSKPVCYMGIYNEHDIRDMHTVVVRYVTDFKSNPDRVIPLYEHPPVPTTDRRETLLDAHARQVEAEDCATFAIGDTVRKTKGSQWHGTVVGTYSTTLTPEGYCVESKYEAGSVQIYPASALELDK